MIGTKSETFNNPKSGFDVLVVSPTPTHPTDQGNRKRIRNICDAMQSRGGRIHFLYFPREWAGKIDLSAYTDMKNKWDFFHVVAPSFPPPHQTDKPHWDIDDWWDGTIGTFIGWLNANVSFDIAIVNYAFLSKALECLPKKTLKILDTHDRLSDRKAMLISNNLTPEFFFTTKEEEAKALNRADLVWAIKDEEKEFFQTITKKPVITVGHIDEPQFVEYKPTRKSTLKLGFLGSDNAINKENLTRFLAKALPIFNDLQANLEIVIAGSVSRFFNESPRVRVLGRLEDVRDFYESVDVCINPFDFSTGLKIKVIEGLSYGVPVIGTVNAFEGVKTDLNYHRFESLEEMALFCVELSKNRKPLTRMADECKEVFQSIHRDVGSAIDRSISLASRRTLVVPTADFYLEKTVAQKRVAYIIRAIAEKTHCTLLYPYQANRKIRKEIEDWQWGITLLFPLAREGQEIDTKDRVESDVILGAAQTNNAGAVVVMAPDYQLNCGVNELTVHDFSGRDALKNASNVRFPSSATGPTILISDSPDATAVLAKRCPAAKTFYIPCFGRHSTTRVSQKLDLAWIICSGEEREKALLDRLILILGGNWRARNSVRINLITTSRDQLVPGADFVRTIHVDDILKESPGEPHVMVDIVGDHVTYSAIWQAALLANVLTVRLVNASTEPSIPSLWKDASTATRTPEALLRVCYGIASSNRIRGKLQTHTPNLIHRGLNAISLSPMVDELVTFLGSPQDTYIDLPVRPDLIESPATEPLTPAIFDEEYYLAVNTDVRVAVELRKFSSGYEHFVKHGKNEKRTYRLLSQNSVLV